MVVGIGIDLVEIERIRQAFDRFGERFAARVLTDAERALLATRSDPAFLLAALWAGKEAASKALGTGYRRGVHPKSLEIVHQATGKPELALHGPALEVARELGVSSAHVSLTHERGMAAAVVVLERA